MWHWPSHFNYLKPVDIELEPVIESHIGADGSFFGTQYANRALAVRFCEFSLAGSSKFSLNKRRNDLEHLRKVQDGVEQAYEALRLMSKQARRVLDPLPEQNPKNNYASMTDEELINSGFDSSLELMAMEVPEDTEQLLYSIKRNCEELWAHIDRDGIDLRVDWKACAIANLAKVAWELRLEKPAPKTIHADAPGPFGRFLADVLEVIYCGYDLGITPSARSAMRALTNITNNGVKPVGNW